MHLCIAGGDLRDQLLDGRQTWIQSDGPSLIDTLLHGDGWRLGGIAPVYRLWRHALYGSQRDEGQFAGATPLACGTHGTERPDAVFLTGDVPWHGGNRADYEVFAHETASWRSEQLRVYPVLGNHEFKGCVEADCLARWWEAFPEESGPRWYGVRFGRSIASHRP